MERKWWTLLAVSVATSMLLLDITVVNVALPSIRQDLGAGFTDLQWVVDAYALTLAALVLPAGSLADRLGRRRLFTAGLAIFSVASLPGESTATSLRSSRPRASRRRRSMAWLRAVVVIQPPGLGGTPSCGHLPGRRQRPPAPHPRRRRCRRRRGSGQPAIGRTPPGRSGRPRLPPAWSRRRRRPRLRPRSPRTDGPRSAP
jgi:Major Facilitator Superfamily